LGLGAFVGRVKPGLEKESGGMAFLLPKWASLFTSPELSLRGSAHSGLCSCEAVFFQISIAMPLSRSFLFQDALTISIVP
jgi:hypothetical protein